MLSLVATPQLSLLQTGVPLQRVSMAPAADIVMGAKAKPKKSTIGKRGISTKKSSQTYVDVTGKAYVEVDSFVPQFDEIGVLPPIGRWDPLKIREQVSQWHAASSAPR